VRIFVWKYLMSCNERNVFRRLATLASLLFFALLIAGCTTPGVTKKPIRVEETTPEAALAYNHGLAKMTAAELGRERMVLVAVPQTPFTQVRMAMLLGHPRVQQDLGKALSLLDSVLKSSDPAASAFHPLARLLADNYLERSRQDSQFDKQGQQLKESQRKASELQEKLDSLADIERTLTPRPRTTRPDGGKR
jgi:hypothetical protein